MVSFPQNIRSKKFLKFIGTLGVLVVVFVCSLALSNRVFGSVFDTMSGQAWNGDDFVDINGNGVQDEWVDVNGNGIQDSGEDQAEHMSPPGGMGWLNFNCTTDLPNTCGTSDYGVNLNINNGAITGYAWSSNYGWMKFGGMAGEIVDPAGQNIVVTDAFVNLSAGTPTARPVSGWSRFCAPAGNAATCSGATSTNLFNGGWDGWVSLSGANYGVTFNEVTREFSGYAWGGNDNAANFVGWISFNCLNQNNCGTSDYAVIYSPLEGPLVTLQADPVVVGALGTSKLTWTGTGLLPGNYCVGTHTGPDVTGWDEVHVSPAGEFTTPPLVAGTYEFTIICQGSLGGMATASATVNAGIQLQLGADPAVVHAPGYVTKLYWNSIPNTPNGILHNCVPSSVPAVSVWNNHNVADIPPGRELANVPVPASPTKFTLRCKDLQNNEVSKDVYVNRGTLPESLTLTNSPVVETRAGSGEYTTTLTWRTVNIRQNSCVASGDGGWSGNKTNPPTGSTSEQNVSVPTSPPPPTLFEYRLTCIGLYSNQPVSASLFLNSGSTSNTIKRQPKYIEY